MSNQFQPIGGTQTILGAGGSIGKELAIALKNYAGEIRLFGRNPQRVNKDDVTIKGDLLNYADVQKAVRESEVVYLVAGFPYTLKAWQSMWPKTMTNVINACKESNTRLVFFDNIYMYSGNDLSNITEELPIDPPSKKGAVRAQISNQLLSEINNGKIKALIARAPDFYGPGISNAVLNEAVLKPVMKGKKANWFCSTDKIHSFIWTPDAAGATAMLGNDEKAYGNVWHLPTSTEKLTAKDFGSMIEKNTGRKVKFQLAGKGLAKFIGLFNPMMKELGEMLYQYDKDYFFNSEKFNKHYSFKTTSYQEGIELMVKAENN